MALQSERVIYPRITFSGTETREIINRTRGVTIKEYDASTLCNTCQRSRRWATVEVTKGKFPLIAGTSRFGQTRKTLLS